MLLKLIPAQSEPTIHFSFSFADLPTNLTAPSAWTAQLSHILVEDLEVPTTSHSLDKAAGITSLLEEVAFDVERGQVRCRFVDGAVEEWAFFRFLDHAVAGGSAGDKQGELEGRKLMIALENIIRNVKESTLEDELFVRELDHVERQRSKTFNGKSSPFKNPKHKKQRSLFMQIVSSIGSMVNITNSSQTLPTHRSPSTTSLHQALQHPSSPGPPLPGTSPRARALRRAARSALVDAYRRFVLSELTHRLPSFSYRDSSGRYTGVHGGGFCVWILHSMRRRAQERLDQLLEEAELRMKERAVEMGVDPFPIQFRKSREESWASGMTIASDRDGEIQVSMDASHRQLEATTMAVPLSFSDDEDDQEMDRDSATVAETDTTDGSSIHTPSSTSHHFATYIGRRPPTIASSESSHSLHSSDGLSDKKASDEFDAQGMLPPRPSAPLPPSPTSPSIPAFSSPPPSPSSTQPAQPQTPTPPPQPSPSHSQYASIRAKNNRISQHLPPTSLFEYTQLVELRERLYHLTVFAESQTRIAAEEVRN